MNGIELIGLDAVLGNIDKWAKQVLAGTQKAVSVSLLNIESNSKRDCPVKTGRLRSDIHQTPDADGLGGTVGTSVIYGPFVEMGTRFMAAQPFLYPNYQAEIPKFKDLIGKVVLKKVI